VPAAFLGRRAVGLGRRLGGRPAEVIAAEVQLHTAEHLFSVLGELKGGAMKVGQWMSAMESALPAQIAGPYGDALARLQDAAPAMPARTMHQVLAEAFGSSWRQQFVEFDDTPAAAASIGQVHRAVWNDGRVVAVKVQYPGAGEALATDLRQLDRLAPALKVAVPALDARALFAELRTQVLAEVDYPQEAESQTAFAAAYRDDADFLVPDVVTVSDRVLVSEWVEGTPVSRIIREGDQSVRDQVGAQLTRFLLSSPVRVGRLHGDPHPGNFRRLGDGRLAVLDFGSTLLMPQGWPNRIGDLLRAARDRDATAAFDIAEAAGLVQRRGVSPQTLMAMLDPLLEPLRRETFTFDRAWMRSETVRFSDPMGQTSRTQRRLQMPVRHLLTQRVAAGTAGVLCQLGATVAVATEAAAWIPELGPRR
jgi:predicted unusual protein kinase regulating ubiquinone biosynthesis (AarF/ABC1/UbiB family)